jgi:hypothetical protein
MLSSRLQICIIPASLTRVKRISLIMPKITLHSAAEIGNEIRMIAFDAKPASHLLPAIAVTMSGAIWGLFGLPLQWLDAEGVGGAGTMQTYRRSTRRIVLPVFGFDLGGVVFPALTFAIATAIAMPLAETSHGAATLP